MDLRFDVLSALSVLLPGHEKQFFNYMKLLSHSNYPRPLKDRSLFLAGPEYLILFHTRKIRVMILKTDLLYVCNFMI